MKNSCIMEVIEFHFDRKPEEKAAAQLQQIHGITAKDFLEFSKKEGSVIPSYITTAIYNTMRNNEMGIKTEGLFKRWFR